MGKIPGKVLKAMELFGSDPLKVLEACDGFYECPKDADGKRIGPLVGYAGKYGKNKDKQYVGDVYANFSMAEQFPKVLVHFASHLQRGPKRKILNEVDVFCGAPMGGIAWAQILAWIFDARFVYMEKKIIKLATKDGREESDLVWKRHGINPGEKVAITEDVTNNFSTTDKMLDLIRDAGGVPVAIASLLNRSLEVDSEYNFLPVISLVRKKILQYKQEDSEVSANIKDGNVIWKPKDNWEALAKVMVTKG